MWCVVVGCGEISKGNGLGEGGIGLEDGREYVY